MRKSKISEWTINQVTDKPINSVNISYVMT